MGKGIPRRRNGKYKGLEARRSIAGKEKKSEMYTAEIQKDERLESRQTGNWSLRILYGMVKCKAIKVSGDNTGENLDDLGNGDDFEIHHQRDDP